MDVSVKSGRALLNDIFKCLKLVEKPAGSFYWFAPKFQYNMMVVGRKTSSEDWHPVQNLLRYRSCIFICSKFIELIKVKTFISILVIFIENVLHFHPITHRLSDFLQFSPVKLFVTVLVKFFELFDDFSEKDCNCRWQNVGNLLWYLFFPRFPDDTVPRPRDPVQ